MDERDHEEKAVQVAATNPTLPEPAAELAVVFEQHRQRVFSAAYRITGNAEDAEDVLQTVFLRLARREGGSPLSDSLGNYLHRAAINAALDIVRSRKSRRATPLEDVETVLSAATDLEPQHQQRGRELREQIRKALVKSSPKAAEIFALRYFEGYGNHEIAKMLGTSRSTINVILHRTRNRLKEEIRSFLGEPS